MDPSLLQQICCQPKFVLVDRSCYAGSTMIDPSLPLLHSMDSVVYTCMIHYRNTYSSTTMVLNTARKTYPPPPPTPPQVHTRGVGWLVPRPCVLHISMLRSSSPRIFVQPHNKRRHSHLRGRFIETSSHRSCTQPNPRHASPV